MKITVLRTSLREFKTKEFSSMRWSDICVKQAKILMPQVIAKHVQPNTTPSPVRGQHITNTGVCTSTDEEAVVPGNQGCTISRLWITQNSPSCSFPDKLPVDFHPGTLSSLERELLLALQFLLLQ